MISDTPESNDEYFLKTFMTHGQKVLVVVQAQGFSIWRLCVLSVLVRVFCLMPTGDLFISI